MEPTANYHKPLGEYLIKADHLVVLVSGVAVKRNRELLDGRWDKHDLKDAANVADLISQGKCQYYDYPGQGLRELRNLLSLKKRLKKQEHSSKVRIRNHLLAQYFPELDKYFDLGGSENLAIVKGCLNPVVIAGLEYKEFFWMVTRVKRGLKQEKRLRLIWEKAAASIGCEVGEAADFEGRLMGDRLSVEGLSL